MGCFENKLCVLLIKQLCFSFSTEERGITKLRFQLCTYMRTEISFSLIVTLQCG